MQNNLFLDLVVYHSIVYTLQVAPATIHPAFMKAASYFGVKIVTVPLTKDYRPDLAQYEMVGLLY